MNFISRFRTSGGSLLTAGACLALLAGCSGNNTQEAAKAPEPKPPEMKLPLSLNQVMVALTDRSAEPFWLAAQNLPKNQQGWDELEYSAMQIALSGVVVSIAGNGPLDETWVSKPEWASEAKKLTDVGMRALAAVRVKDAATIMQVGSDLVAVCEGCHAKFKPDIPTSGILMHSEYYKPGATHEGKGKGK